MTGNERDILQLKKREVKALERANDLKATELKIMKLQVIVYLTAEQINEAITDITLDKLNELEIR